LLLQKHQGFFGLATSEPSRPAETEPATTAFPLEAGRQGVGFNNLASVDDNHWNVSSSAFLKILQEIGRLRSCMLNFYHRAGN
jgi:hypothetical protein